MAAPKPHDPRQTTMTVAQLEEQVEAILDTPAASLADEVEQLSHAHAVLAQALQDNS